jgi:penicillin-binding protein 1A
MNTESRFSKLLIACISALLGCFVIGCFVVLAVFYSYSSDLPDPTKLAKYEPPIITRIYANDGRLMAEYAAEHRLYLPLDAIPRRVKEAFLSAEDKNFYEHGGIDFFSLARAMLTNVNNYASGRSLVGGSTITQQVVKNFLLTNERSLERKIKEAILAFRIDRIYSKDRILELYLNEIYLGSGSYGVAAAALNYFNKTLEELTVAEAAYLAALPKAPSNYHPNKNYEAAKARRDWVISRLQEDDKITEEEANIATSSPITLRERDKAEVVKAPFFAEEVRRRLAKMYGSEVLYEGGLFVKTTLDPALQQYADTALRHALVEYDRRHGYRGPVVTLPTLEEWKSKLEELTATVPLYDEQDLAVVDNVSDSGVSVLPLRLKKGDIPIEQMRWARRFVSETQMGAAVSSAKEVLMVGDVVLIEPVIDADGKVMSQKYRLLQIPKVNGGLVVMDPHTGRILALTGGYSALGTQFNRATQAQRQPGSTFKPFVYLAGLEAGYTPASILWDSPISLPQGPGLPNWTPQNYHNTYMGPVPLRIGVEKSVNMMTVYLASRMGIKRIREMGRRMGIYKDLPAEYSAVLGSHETTLLKMVNAYAMIANGGKRVEASPIERIDDRYGKIIYRRDPRECGQCQQNTIPKDTEIKRTPPPIMDNREKVIDPATDYQMISILQGVVERGTAIRAKSLGLPIAGKTGTTNDSRDTWFVGFSPDLVVGLYVGYDQPKSLGEKETGSSVALPGFIKFMELAAKGKPSRDFTIPKGIQLTKVDRWSGRPTSGSGGNVILEAFKIRQPSRMMPSPALDAALPNAEAKSGSTAVDAVKILPQEQIPATDSRKMKPKNPKIIFGEDEEPDVDEQYEFRDDEPAVRLGGGLARRKRNFNGGRLDSDQGTGGLY